MKKHRVLIVDRSPTMRALLRREFARDRFDVFEAGDADEAIRMARDIRPAVVTLSAVLAPRDGFEVCAEITGHETTRNTTVVMITSADSDTERSRAFEAGAVRFLDKGFPEGKLARYADEIMQARGRLADTRILVVDDSAFIRAAIVRVLKIEGATLLEAGDGAAALDVLAEREVDVIMTDYHMPNMDGVTFVRTLRGLAECATTPVLFLSGSDDSHTAVHALDAGANDFIRKPFEATELLARVCSAARLATLTKELKMLATTDELTGLANRRQGLVQLDALRATADRYDEASFACIMLDIDHFKRFNDTHGHEVGDMVLRETASVLRDSVREVDTICRLGGEEFLVLCPQTDAAGAAACAEKLRAAVEQHGFAHGGQMLKVTVSLGVAEYQQHMRSADVVLKVADNALYAAKQAGRNTVCVGQDAALTSDGQMANV